MGKHLFISMYHYTRELIKSRYPNIKGLDISLFRKQLEFFKESFNVVSMEQVLDAVKRGHALPEKALLLTFDDGYMDNYLYALPLLEEFGFQGSFFIPGKTFAEHKLLDVNKIHFLIACADSQSLYAELLKKLDYYRGREYSFPSNNELIAEYAEANRFDDKEIVFVKRILQTALPERLRSMLASELFEKYVGISEEILAHELYMTEEQIKTMRRHGMFIGIHGYDHYWLGELPVEQMKSDIDKALDVMNEFVDPNCWVMNYPYGSYNMAVVEYAREKGAMAGLTTDVRVSNLEEDDEMLLPRLDCNDFPPKSENYIKWM